MKLRRQIDDLVGRACYRSAEFHSAVPQVSNLPSSGSILVIVLWVALGLVTVALYFANSMSFELRASDNGIAGLAADQAIEGGARYVLSVLALSSTNGGVPDLTSYRSQAVPVGDAHFWLIGRPGDYQVQPDEVFFGLVDEGSKLNLNNVTVDNLALLTNMTPELAANIVDWRDTNGAVSANGDGPTIYSQFQPPYICKNSPFETTDELRLVYPSDLGTLLGEDFNRNGALDPSESDTNRNNWIDPGILEYVTVYSREPNTQSNGTARVSISLVSSTSADLINLLQTNLSSARYTAVATALGLIANQPGGGPRPGGGRPPPPPAPRRFASPLQFYMASGLSADEFALIANSITVATGTYIQGRVNVNTAPAAVLACLPGFSADLAQQLVNYRRQNPTRLTSIAWVPDALGASSSTASALAVAGDYITTQSYQFTADIAALGPFGRGYRRVKFIFDTSTGKPQVIYRQDLSHLGWALGRYARQDWLLTKKS
ncbi:MAG TPA: type II secretion system protein GspK [Candidatus Limnocylindrales bacterium]|jgi:type II secretory pathway component PulK|nr:type II secretion system protein GspK [Candidatus Limnocylindrales bacterium]